MSEKLLRVMELAAEVGISRITIHRHVKLGYRFKYPILRRTTLEHYLEWASKQEMPPRTRDEQFEQEMENLHAVARGNHPPKSES